MESRATVPASSSEYFSLPLLRSLFAALGINFPLQFDYYCRSRRRGRRFVLFSGKPLLPLLLSLLPSRVLSVAPLKSVDLLREMDDFGCRRSAHAHARTGKVRTPIEGSLFCLNLPTVPPAGRRWHSTILNALLP